MVTDARSLNAWRRWGYRILPGDLYSYILHMRPAEWPIMAGHTALGYILAVGWHGARTGEHIRAAVFALVMLRTGRMDRKSALAYGPFLILGALVAVLA